MIKIVIIMWVISHFLVKNTRGTLACGLTAYNGPVAADPTKLKLIALFNEDRGKDSCGIFNGGKTTYGCKATKNELISQVFKDVPIRTNKDWRNVMIHTRKATFGSHTIENCHPFAYTKGNKRQWFMHNGTVRNWEDLAKKFDLDPKNYSVDSHALGEMVFKGNTEEMLASYKGAGAMMWCNNTNKNTLYVWKGGAGDKEERPLFYYKDSKTGGCYFSSVIEPLWILSDTKNAKDSTPEVFVLNLNTLYTFEDGVIVARKEIARGEELHENFIMPNVSIQKSNHISSGQGSQKDTGTSSHVGKTLPTTSNTWKDTLSDSAYNKITKGVEGFVNFLEGRFTRNGHVLEGEVTLDELGIVGGNNGVSQTFYFFNGIMIKDEESMKELQRFKSLKWFISRFYLESVALYPFAVTSYPAKSDVWWTYSKHSMRNSWVGLEKPDMTIQLPFEEDDTFLIFEKGVLKDIEENESEEEFVNMFVEDTDNILADLFLGVEQVLSDYNDVYGVLGDYLKEEDLERVEAKIAKLLKIKEIFDKDDTREENY